MTEREHLRQVLVSSLLRSSEALQKLLGYLGEQSLSDPPHAVKEYQIATEVLGRGPDFDPRNDSSVRVNVARLRSKLLEYYATEGIHDPVRMEIPKGSYLVVFRRHEAPAEVAVAQAAAPDPPPPTATSVENRRRWSLKAVAAAAISGVICGALIASWTDYGSTVSGAAAASRVMQRFWSEFSDSPARTIVFYGNTRFVGDGETGMRYYNPAVHRPQEVHDLHTGIGELVGVYELSRVFQSLGKEFEIRRAALLDWAAVKKANVIFVGGPAENMPIRELGSAAKYVFERATDADGRSHIVVVNKAPREGEPRLFDPGGKKPMRRDYAVIRLSAGFFPDRHILILSGTTTLGTQGAVEFVCRQDALEALILKLAPEDSGMREFECVLEVSINGNVPVGSKIVAFRDNAEYSATLTAVE